MQTADPSVAAMQSQISLLQSQVAALLNHKHLGTDSLQVDYSNLTDIEKAEGKVLSIIAGSGISLSPSSGIGNVTVNATSTNLSNVRGTDTTTLNTHSGSTTHTITHGLGRTVTMIIVSATLNPSGVTGSGTLPGQGGGMLMLDGSGNNLGGFAMASIADGSGGSFSGYSHVNQNSQAPTGAPTSINAATVTSGGTANMSITVNNVTPTTFDIVYSVSDDGGFGAPTQNFTAQWSVL